MAKRIAVTQAEERALRFCEMHLDGDPVLHEEYIIIKKLVAKLDKTDSKSKPMPGLTVSQFLDILKQYRKPAVLRDAEASYFVRLTRLLRNAGQSVTEENTRVVCSWLDRQQWLDVATPQQILQKWTDWLARAQANRPAGRPTVGLDLDD